MQKKRGRDAAPFFIQKKKIFTDQVRVYLDQRT